MALPLWDGIVDFSPSSTSQGASDPIESIIPHPGQHLFPVPFDMQVASLTPPSRAVSVEECCSGCSRTVTDARVQGVQPPWEGGKGPAPVGRGASSWASPGLAQVGFAAGAASPGPL